MTTNSDITIFNKRYVKEDRTEIFLATKIKGVSLYTRTGTVSNQSLSKTSLSRSDTHTIRIPIDADMGEKKYVDEREYKMLDNEVVSGYWTLQPGAIIVPCLVDVETATETEIKKNYSDVIFVRNYTDNRSRCSDAMKHWRIGGE